MVGIYAAVSTANHMAMWGGAEPLLGTNPIAIGIPAGKEAPVVLDIATSVSSFGNIRQYQVAGKPMPEGWVVHSKTGQPIVDPKKVSEGVLLPIGGHKGGGLALIIGLLAGVLNGAAFGRDVVDRRLRRAADQHRAVRHRARRRPLPAAGAVRRRDGPPSQRAARLAHAAGLRRHPPAGGKKRADRSANGVPLPAG
jgi:LDH2 family malate/lactate/ureidoglycolate dehydrogenase